MRKYRTWDEVEQDYFCKHPEEIDGYIDFLFEEYAEDGDAKTLLSCLRNVIRAKGMTAVAKEVGMTRKGLQKALSREGNPSFQNVLAIMKSIGYEVAFMKTGAHAH